MKCPRCGASTEVKETRPFEYETLRRRRECANGHRFTSVEVYREVYCSARQRANVYARSMARWRQFWVRNMDMLRNSHLGWEHFAAKYGIGKSNFYLVVRQMRMHLRKINK